MSFKVPPVSQSSVAQGPFISPDNHYDNWAREEKKWERPGNQPPKKNVSSFGKLLRSMRNHRFSFPGRKAAPPPTPTAAAPMSYDRLRSLSSLQALTPHFLDTEIKAGSALCREIQFLFRRYLHEYDPKVGFRDRNGAFGYEEVYYACMKTVNCFDASIQSLFAPPLKENDPKTIASPLQATPDETHPFLKRNVAFLTHELTHLTLVQKGQIGTFRQLLVDFAYIRVTAEKQCPQDQEKTHSLLNNLRQLEHELRKTTTVIQERMLDLQPMMMTLTAAMHAQHPAINHLADLDGRRFCLGADPLERSTLCAWGHSLYGTYAHEILEPNFLYCSRFLTVLLLCKSSVLEFQHSRKFLPNTRPTAPQIILPPVT